MSNFSQRKTAVTVQTSLEVNILLTTDTYVY